MNDRERERAEERERSARVAATLAKSEDARARKFAREADRPEILARVRIVENEELQGSYDVYSNGIRRTVYERNGRILRDRTGESLGTLDQTLDYLEGMSKEIWAQVEWYGAGTDALREKNRPTVNSVLWTMLQTTERDRSIRGEVDVNVTPSKGAAWRQGYIDALRDVRDALQSESLLGPVKNPKSDGEETSHLGEY